MAFPTIPTVAAGRVLTANQADASGTRTFPSLTGLTKNAGDLLIAIVVAHQDAGSSGAIFSSWGGGFTEFSDQMTTSGSTMCVGLAYKWSTGSETGTFAVTQASPTGHASMVLLSIPGAHASTPPEAGTIANGTGAAADPGSLNPSGWDAEDTLWISLVGSGMTSGTGSWTATGTTAPTSYTDRVDSNTTDNSTVGQTEAAVAFRQLNAASEDVGTAGVDTSNARNAALVIAVRPAEAAAAVTGAGALATLEAFGIASVRRIVANLGAILTAEAFADPRLIRLLQNAGAAASLEAHGAPRLVRLLSPVAVGSGEAFGTPVLIYVHGAGNIGSLELFGVAKVIRLLNPQPLATLEAFGEHRLSPIWTVTAAGNIPTGEQHGEPRLLRTLQPAALTSLEAFANPALTRLILQAGAIGSAEQHGQTALTRLLQQAGAIGSLEAFGTPAANRLLGAVGILTGEAHGQPRLVRVVAAINIATAETFGDAQLVGGTIVSAPSAPGDAQLSDRLTFEVAIIDGQPFLLALSDVVLADANISEVTP